MGTTPKEERVKSSNFGKKTVDIAAPGVNVYSTYPGGRYGEMTGTSQATAFATGVAAMIMDRYPDFSAQQVKKYILKTGDYIPKLRELNGTSRRLNSYKALVTLDSDVSAMGTLATNTQHMNPLQFTAEGNGVFAAQGNSSFGSLSNFSKNLKNALEEKSQNKRLRLPNNQK